LNPPDQDSLNAAAGGNLLEKSPQDGLTIIENKSKVHNSRRKPIASLVNACEINSSFEIAKLTYAVNQQTSVVTTAMMAMLKQLQANPSPAQVKVVEEICVTCGGADPYYQCLAADGNTFPEFKDNIQGYVLAAAGNYDQVLMPKYQKMLRALLSNKEKLQVLANTPLNENCSAVILKKLPEKLGDPGKFLIPCGFSLPDLIPTRMTLEFANHAIFMPDGIVRDVFVPVGKFTFPPDFVIVDYESDPRVPLILGRPFLRTARALIDVHGEEMILHCLEVLDSNKKSGNPTFSLHKEIASSEVTHEIRDSEGLPLFHLTRCLKSSLMNLLLSHILRIMMIIFSDIKFDLREIEFLLYQGKDYDLKDSIDQMDLANLDAYFVDPTPEMFTDEHAHDYSFPPRFDVTARALIDVYGEEMILRDKDERLTLNMKHDTASYSNHPHRESVNLINIFNILIEDCLEVLVPNKQSGNPTFSLHKEITSPKVTHEIHDSKGCTFLSEELPNIDSFNDIHPHFDDKPLSGSTTYSSNSLLEEFTDELALITYPPDYDDNLQ
nr:reverse transcriptase domain-containing protein [Tanacetum cinerariifolium]